MRCAHTRRDRGFSLTNKILMSIVDVAVVMDGGGDNGSGGGSRDLLLYAGLHSIQFKAHACMVERLHHSSQYSCRSCFPGKSSSNTVPGPDSNSRIFVPAKDVTRTRCINNGFSRKRENSISQ